MLPQALPSVRLPGENAHLFFQVFVTSENLILAMSFFRLPFVNTHLLVSMLTIVAGDFRYSQGNLHFKNATVQQHYGRTAEVSSSNCCVLCSRVCVTVNFVLNLSKLVGWLNGTCTTVWLVHVLHSLTLFTIRDFNRRIASTLKSDVVTSWLYV